eukprot:365907-Chlamydomonas_euryale.AAC.18
MLLDLLPSLACILICLLADLCFVCSLASLHLPPAALQPRRGEGRAMASEQPECHVREGGERLSNAMSMVVWNPPNCMQEKELSSWEML